MGNGGADKKADSAAMIASVALVGLAAFLLPLPAAASPLFKLVAVVGGLAGYWAGSWKLEKEVSLIGRLAIGLVAILLAAIGSWLIDFYFAQSYTAWYVDVGAMFIYGASFAIACSFFARLRIAMFP